MHIWKTFNYYALLVIYLDRPPLNFTAYRECETFREFALANSINFARYITNELHAEMITRAYLITHKLSGMVNPLTLTDETIVNGIRWEQLKESLMECQMTLDPFFVSRVSSY